MAYGKRRRGFRGRRSNYGRGKRRSRSRRNYVVSRGGIRL